MAIAKIKEILTREFESAEDKKYWEDKLEEAEQKEIREKQNEIFRNKYFKYER